MQVVWDKDLAEDSPLPWYLPLDPSRFSLSSFRLTSVGRMITRTMVRPINSLFHFWILHLLIVLSDLF